MLRISPGRKGDIQAAFRFFKQNNQIGHDLVQSKLMELLGRDFVQESWVEARANLSQLQQQMWEEQRQQQQVEQRQQYHRISEEVDMIGHADNHLNNHSPYHHQQHDQHRRHSYVMRWHPYSNEAYDSNRRRIDALRGRNVNIAPNPTFSLYNALQSTDEDNMEEGEEQPLEYEEFLPEGAPDAFICPISLHLMRDPVVAGDTHTYSRLALKRWIAQNRKGNKGRYSVYMTHRH